MVSLNEVDFKPLHNRDMMVNKPLIKEVIDESNKTDGSSVSSNERMNTEMPNETKISNSTFGGKAS